MNEENKHECISYSIFNINNVPVIRGVHLAHIFEIELQEITEIVEKNMDCFPLASCYPWRKDKNGKKTYAFTEFGAVTLCLFLNKEKITRYQKKISKMFNEHRESGRDVFEALIRGASKYRPPIIRN